MFFGYSFYRVEGDSMSPSIPKESFIVIKQVNKFTIKDFFVFNHQTYGKLMKKLVEVDSNNQLWFEGEFKESVSKKDIGPIKKNQIIGRVVLSISEKSLKFFN